MSQHVIKSPKHCAKQSFNPEKIYKRLWYIVSTLFTTLLLIFFFTWLILHPSNPQFHLQQVDIYQLNLSSTTPSPPPNLLTSSMQIALIANNPNKRLGLSYHNLKVFASYKAEQITNDAFIPPFYQGHEDSKTLTCALVGDGLPVSPSFAYDVSHDQTIGRIVLRVKLNGHVRWKMGSLSSRSYRFDVDCTTIMPFGVMNNNVGWNSPLSSKQGTQCSTSV